MLLLMGCAGCSVALFGDSENACVRVKRALASHAARCSQADLSDMPDCELVITSDGDSSDADDCERELAAQSCDDHGVPESCQINFVVLP